SRHCAIRLHLRSLPSPLCSNLPFLLLSSSPRWLLHRQVHPRNALVDVLARCFLAVSAAHLESSGEEWLVQAVRMELVAFLSLDRRQPSQSQAQLPRRQSQAQPPPSPPQVHRRTELLIQTVKLQQSSLQRLLRLFQVKPPTELIRMAKRQSMARRLKPHSRRMETKEATERMAQRLPFLTTAVKAMVKRMVKTRQRMQARTANLLL
ncbi:unnamed protein product, partial [Aphanomyces euteiches]